MKNPFIVWFESLHRVRDYVQYTYYYVRIKSLHYYNTNRSVNATKTTHPTRRTSSCFRLLRGTDNDIWAQSVRKFVLQMHNLIFVIATTARPTFNKVC
jgi:hypothetical protein